MVGMLQVITQQPAILKRPELLMDIFGRLPWWLKWMFVWNAPSICSLDYTSRFLLNTIAFPVTLSLIVYGTWVVIREGETRGKDGDNEKYGSTIERMRKQRDLCVAVVRKEARKAAGACRQTLWCADEKHGKDTIEVMREGRDLWLEHRATIMRHVENSPNQEQQTEESDELAKYLTEKKRNEKLEAKCLPRLNEVDTNLKKIVRQHRRSFFRVLLDGDLQKEHREPMKWFLTWKERNDAKQLFRAEYQRLTMRSDYYTVVFLCYPTISRTCFDHLNCRWLSKETIVLDSDYGVDCWSGRWMALGVLSVGLIALMVLIPLILTYNMGKSMAHMKRQMRKLTQGGTHRLKALVHQDFSYDYGAVVNDYRQGAYYAECVDLYRKLVMTGLLTVITPGSVFQGYCSVMFSLTFMLLHVKMWPYKTRSKNVLKLFADIEVFLVSFTGLLLQLDSDKLAIKKSWYTDGPRFNCVAANATNEADSARCKSVTDLQADDFKNGIITATERDDPSKCEAELDHTRAVCTWEHAGDGSLYEIALLVWSIVVTGLFLWVSRPTDQDGQSLIAEAAALKGDEDDSGKCRCELSRRKREKLKQRRDELMTHTPDDESYGPDDKDSYLYRMIQSISCRCPCRCPCETKTETPASSDPDSAAELDAAELDAAELDALGKLAAGIIGSWEEKYSEKNPLHKDSSWVNSTSDDDDGADSDSDADADADADADSGLPAIDLDDPSEGAAADTTDSDWEEKYSEQHDRKYWVNTSTGERTWHEPESAKQQLRQSNQTDNSVVHKDSDWAEKYSEQHSRKFWMNATTGERTWHEPKPRLSSSVVDATSDDDDGADSDADADSGLPAIDLDDPSEGAAADTTDSDWEEKYSEQHDRKYWVNTSTGELTWNDPESRLSTSVVDATLTSESDVDSEEEV
eukprot:COSAG06_NODE_4324_length_4366_cov_3.080853_1_plen_917_part_00